MIPHKRESKIVPHISTIELLRQFFEAHPGSSVNKNLITKDVLRELRYQSHPVEFCVSKNMISQNSDYHPPTPPKA